MYHPHCSETYSLEGGHSRMTSSYILLPGWSMHQSVFYPLQSVLSQYAPTICVDYRNIASKEEITNRTKQMIAAVTTSSIFHPMKNKGDDNRKVTLIGWSLGAIAALETALALPEKINRLILISGTACFVQEKRKGWSARIVKKMQESIISSPEETLKAFDQLLFSEEEKEKWLPYFVECIRPSFSKDSPKSLFYGLDYLLYTDVREKLSALHVPTLFIHGEKDQICPLAAVTTITKKIPHSQMHIVPNAGHVPFLTQREQCLDKILEFCLEEVADGK